MRIHVTPWALERVLLATRFDPSSSFESHSVVALHRHPLQRLSTGPTPLMLRRQYPTDADQYELKEECGRGVSATVRCLLWAMACQLLVSSAACCLPVHSTWGCACRGERMILSLRSVHRAQQCLCAVQDTQCLCAASVCIDRVHYKDRGLAHC